jgi:hypothetical protein
MNPSYPFPDEIYAHALLDVQHRTRAQLFDGSSFTLPLSRLAHIDLSGMTPAEITREAFFEKQIDEGYGVRVVVVFPTGAALPQLVRSATLYGDGFPALAAARTKGVATLTVEVQFPVYDIDQHERWALRMKGVSIP